MSARVQMSSFFLVLSLFVGSTSVSAVTITFTERISSLNDRELAIDVMATVTTDTPPTQDIPACPALETAAGAPPCVRRILSSSEFGFVELSVTPDLFAAAPESDPAKALLLEPDGTISDKITLIVDRAVPTGRPRDTVTVRFESDPIEAGFGPAPSGFRFAAPETGGLVDLTSKLFTGEGTDLRNGYSLPSGFFVKAVSDLDSVPEPSTLLLLVSGLAGLGVVTRQRRRGR